MSEPVTDTRLSEWAKNPALGAVAVVAVLAAVGVAGDLLPRLVRNQPLWAALLVSAAVVSLFVMLIGRGPWLLVGTLLLAAALVGVIFLGVGSLSEREIPHVTLAVTQKAEPLSTTVAVTGTATSQRSTETMLVQVLGFPSAVDPEVLSGACRGSRRTDDAGDDQFSVLLWNESGPDQTGRSRVETTLDVPSDDFAVVCVGVFLRERDRNDAEDDRIAWAYSTVP
ncbi:hypothetical protein [Blastococcus sp. CT_GayMR16]|uniref:hypothetical protein n=1 Tax=Blastococcus sp. CT_GayMR16 TaxID=2559607 RepID=UPI0010730E1A|nr:hypothetical protein [Blastococcus sp. CT_GayMR16]TFV87806.1 hypothetical protein E4P38_12595 [Blastococcus sp. CT_GayMR16]